MRIDDFYMVLPSNSSPETYPHNTAGDFIVNWENPVDLDPDAKWHVALTELSYIYNPSTISTNYSIRYTSVIKTEQYRIDQKLYYDRKSTDGIGHQLLKDVEWDFFNMDFEKPVHYNAGVDQPDERFPYSINFDTWIPKMRKNPDKQHEMMIACKRAFTISFSNEDRDKLKIDTNMSYAHANSRTSDGFWYVPIGLTYEQCIELIKKPGEIKILGTVHRFEDIKYTFHFGKDREFQTSQDFVKYIADNCSVIFENITYDETTNRIALTLRDTIVEVELCGGLHFALGFTKAILCDPDPESRKNLLPYRPPTTLFSKRSPQLHRGVMNMFIYASICEPIYVGHTRVPLLKNVFVDASDDIKNVGHARNSIVYNPMYIPVASTSFNNIERNIRNDAGKIITFPIGAVSVLTLHFKKM